MGQENLSPVLAEKHHNLCAALRALGRVAVAFSGGVDSSLLALVATRSLGAENVTALHMSSCLLPSGETALARRTAEEIGCSYTELEVNPLALEIFRQNPPDRCYHCKRFLFASLLDHLEENFSARLVDGTNRDDLGTDRPGLRALGELGVGKPLADAGLTKMEIRALGRHFGLGVWNLSSGSCLATRIPSGREISLALLQQVAECEDFLLEHGVSVCRVRLYEDRTVVEIAEADMKFFADSGWRKFFLDFFSARGLGPIHLSLSFR